MKKIIIIICSTLCLGFNLSAQEVGGTKTPTQKEPKEEKEPKGSKETPNEDKRTHTEEKSDGNAFSGNGNGGDKNLVNPAGKSKKEKKPKKNKKSK